MVGGCPLAEAGLAPTPRKVTDETRMASSDAVARIKTNPPEM
jgi:hypothetical protein